MAKVRIKHVAWRDGRPRFAPGPGLRADGHRGKDLRHDDGRWYSFEEAAAWSAEHFPSGLPKAERPLTGLYLRGYVYFLWAGDAIKVGFSANPFRRVNALMTGVADPMRMFVAVPGTNGDERRLHRRLRAQRIRGEWFKASRFTLNVMRMVLNENDGINGEQ